MRTVRTKIYQFNELNDNAKQVAIEKERENLCTAFAYDEAHNTVIKFNELFNLKNGSNSWLDCYTSNIDDDILELKGFRLHKYILNNYGSFLFNKKYLKSGQNRTDKPSFTHPMMEVKKISQGKNKGLYYVSYYSNFKKDNSCVLTGVYFDDEMLQPIYDFLEKRDFKNCTITFYHLLNNCFEAIEKTIEREIEYMNTDEYLIENIESNEYEFTENGNLFF